MTAVCKQFCHPSLIVLECLCMQRHRHCRDEASLYPAAAICVGHLGLLKQLTLLCPFVKQQGESLLSCCLY